MPCSSLDCRDLGEAAQLAKLLDTDRIILRERTDRRLLGLQLLTSDYGWLLLSKCMTRGII
jgi:hypothetical protein